MISSKYKILSISVIGGFLDGLSLPLVRKITDLPISIQHYQSNYFLHYKRIPQGIMFRYVAEHLEKPKYSLKNKKTIEIKTALDLWYFWKTIMLKETKVE